MGKRTRRVRNALIKGISGLLGGSGGFFSMMSPYIRETLEKTAPFGLKLGLPQGVIDAALDAGIKAISHGSLEKGVDYLKKKGVEYLANEMQPNASIPPVDVADRNVAFLGSEPKPMGQTPDGHFLYGNNQPQSMPSGFLKDDEVLMGKGYAPPRAQTNRSYLRQEMYDGVLREIPNELSGNNKWNDMPYIPPHSTSLNSYGWVFRPVGKGTNLKGQPPGFDTGTPFSDVVLSEAPKEILPQKRARKPRNYKVAV